MSIERLEELRKLKRLKELRALKAAQERPIGSLETGKKPEIGIGDAIVGGLEAGTQFTTGAMLEPFAGLAGMYDPENIQEVRGMAYQPRTEAGKGAVKAVGNLMEPVAKGLQASERFLGDVAYDVTGSPAVAAGAATIPAAALEGLGLMGIRGGKQAINQKRAMQLEQARQAARQPEFRSNYAVDDQGNVMGGGRLQQYDRDINVDPNELEQLRRQQLFEELEIPTTRSRITQDARDMAIERQLARNNDLPEAQLLRDRIADESAAFAETTRKLADDLGIPRESGELIKEVLYEGKRKSKEAYKAAYQDLAKLTEGAGIPVSDRRIKELIESNMDFNRIANDLDPSDLRRINDTLVEFGIDRDPASIKSWTERSGAGSGMIGKTTEVTPLNILNHREFNKSLNSMIDPANPTLNKAVGMIKESVSSEVNDMVDALMSMPAAERGKVGNLTLDVAQAAKRANDLFIKYKRDFEAKDLVGDLTRKKTGSFDTEFILGSQVADKMMSNTALGKIENIRKTVNLLSREGEKGKKALGNLQSHVAMSLLNDATRAISQKLKGGVTRWSGTDFAKAMDKIGEEKLGVIFKNNPAALKRLYKIREAGIDANFYSDIAKSPGTADDLLNAMVTPEIKRVFGVIGGIKGWLAVQSADKAGSLFKARAQRKQLKQALNNRPVLKQNFQQFKSNYPELAAALMLGQVATTGKENND